MVKELEIKIKMIKFTRNRNYILIFVSSIGIIIISLFFVGKALQAATFLWQQDDWSGGADTVNFPNHDSNQTGWNKYYSKAGIDVVSGDLKLERK